MKTKGGGTCRLNSDFKIVVVVVVDDVVVVFNGKTLCCLKALVQN